MKLNSCERALIHEFASALLANPPSETARATAQELVGKLEATMKREDLQKIAAKLKESKPA